MASLGDLVVRLVANTSQYDRNLKKSQSTTQKFTSTARKLGAVLAGIGFAAIGRQAVSAAIEQAQAEKKLAAVLKSTGGAAGLSAGQIQSYAASLQAATNFGDEVTISAAAMLATFKQIYGRS